MEQTELLKRSAKGLEAQIVLSGLAMLLVAVFATWLIHVFFKLTPHSGIVAILLAWFFFFVIWGVAALQLWYQWRVKRYEIGRDALIVYAKAGKLGTSQTIYRYESVVSVRMTQGFLGKRFGYGDIRLTIPKIDGEVTLNDIEQPRERMLSIQQRLNERGSDTHALIN